MSEPRQADTIARLEREIRSLKESLISKTQFSIKDSEETSVLKNQLTSTSAKLEIANSNRERAESKSDLWKRYVDNLIAAIELVAPEALNTPIVSELLKDKP